MAKKDKKSTAQKHPDEPEIEEVENGDEEDVKEPDAPAEAPAPDEAPKEAENEEPAVEPGVTPPSPGSHKITIEGKEGDENVVLSVNGEARSLPVGVEVEVGDDIMTTLEQSSLKFTRAKS